MEFEFSTSTGALPNCSEALFGFANEFAATLKHYLNALPWIDRTARFGIYLSTTSLEDPVRKNALDFCFRNI